MKLKLTIAFDGTAYKGWQVQKTGLGIQEHIDNAIRKIFPEAPRTHSSSRTDSGVHALGMVAQVELPGPQFKMSPDKFVIAVNSYLPQDIRVMSAVPVPEEFNARYDAKGKQYRYFLWNGPAMNPLLRLQAWQVHRTLDVPAMRAGAKFLIGRHDFKSLAATHNYEMASTVRTLTRCDIRKQGQLLTFIIEGDGFLYKMCRGIVGTLAQVGEGKTPPEEIKNILEKKDRRAAGISAPAHGLILWKVYY